MIPDVPVVLLAGPGSKRLEKIALGTAARLVCRQGGRGPGCGGADCPDCRRLFRREHPDLIVAAPEDRRRANVPEFEGSGEGKQTTIPTALVRAIVAGASRLPYEAPRRAVLLLDVDRTEPAAFSALLKVLEEPPQKTRFILTATRPRLLPPTILSRVVVHSLPGDSRERIEAALLARGLPADEAQARTAFAPQDAEEAAALDLAEARSGRDALLEALSGVFLSGSVSWAIHLSSLLAGEDATGTADRLVLLATLLRDASAAAIDPAGHGVVHKERFRDLERLGAIEASRLLDAALDALNLAADLPDSRRNPRLAAEAFALGLVSAA